MQIFCQFRLPVDNLFAPILPLSELKKLCLLSESALKNNEFEGLCPECTRKWLEKQKEVDRGKKASFIIIDEL